MLFLALWIFTLITVLLLYVYFLRVSRIWKENNVPHTTPRFPLGDFHRSAWSTNLGVYFKSLYEEFPKERFFGIWMFMNPLLIVRDLDLIKAMFVKDFSYFHDRGFYYNKENDPLSAHLFAIEGAKWKNLREKLTPTFTSGKMKMMFPLVVECSEELEDYLKGPAEREEIVEIREIVARFMTDVISLCAFGIKTNSLKYPKAKFREMGRKTQDPSLRTFLIALLQFCLPKAAEFFKLRVFPKDVSDYFLAVIRDVMENREKHNITRKDFMQLLIELKNNGIIKETDKQFSNGNVEKLTFEEVAAEAFVFFLAGFETSSSTVQFALYELAKNPHIQDNLRKEILNSLAENGNQLTYQGVVSTPYLDKVIDETLRKYPVVPSLLRQCNKDYRIPDSDAIIPKGTVIHVPIYGIQMDEKYYPDPERFDPERFSEKEKAKRHQYAYLPFGEGPRNCIGKRFGQMQVRVALIVMLRHFKFELPAKSKQSIQFDPQSFVLLVKGGLHLRISRFSP